MHIDYRHLNEIRYEGVHYSFPLNIKYYYLTLKNNIFNYPFKNSSHKNKFLCVCVNTQNNVLMPTYYQFKICLQP